jgi:hypothetical protein
VPVPEDVGVALDLARQDGHPPERTPAVRCRRKASAAVDESSRNRDVCALSGHFRRALNLVTLVREQGGGSGPEITRAYS